MKPDSKPRRRLLQTAGAMALATPVAAAADGPSAPARTPGKPGDFDFLTGQWKIAHRQRRAGRTEWDQFNGEATCWSILGGVCHIEELRIPARNFSGMGLRLLDIENRLWRDHWVNAKGGVIGVPGMPGSFENGAGIFEADDEDQGQPIKVRGVWDRITPVSCRWHQAVSRDGGRSWDANWWMEWTREG